MLVPLSWLKDFVDIDIEPKELEKKLFDCGFEVEECWEVGKDISNVVVGEVLTCEPIPDNTFMYVQLMQASMAHSRYVAELTTFRQEESTHLHLLALQLSRLREIM